MEADVSASAQAPINGPLAPRASYKQFMKHLQLESESRVQTGCSVIQVFFMCDTNLVGRPCHTNINEAQLQLPSALTVSRKLSAEAWKWGKSLSSHRGPFIGIYWCFLTVM